MITRSIRKKTLTLIELVVVIVLVGSLGFAITLSVRKFFMKSQVLYDRARFESILKMGRANAILSETDWDLELFFHRGKTDLIWKCREDPKIKKILPKTSLATGVKVFLGEEKEPLKKIVFFSSGWVFPCSTLRLECLDGKSEIDLKKILQISIDAAPPIEEILEK